MTNRQFRTICALFICVIALLSVQLAVLNMKVNKLQKTAESAEGGTIDTVEIGKDIRADIWELKHHPEQRNDSRDIIISTPGKHYIWKAGHAAEHYML